MAWHSLWEESCGQPGALSCTRGLAGWVPTERSPGWEWRLSVCHKEEENEALTKREDICRVGQSHNPVVILRDKLGSSVWLGKPPPCSWLFSLLLRPVSGKVFHLLPGRRAEGKSDQPLGGLRGNWWIVFVCFANVTEVSWLKI